MKPFRHLSSTLLFILLILITAWWLFRDIEFADLSAAFCQAKKGYILAAVSMMLLFIAGEALKMRQTFALLGQKTSYWKCLSFSFVGFYFNAITPSASGGQPVQLYYMKKAGVDLSCSTLALLILALVHQFVMVCYSLLMFWSHSSFIFHRLGPMTPLFLFGVLFNLLIFFLLLFIIFSRHGVQSFITVVAQVLQKLPWIKQGNTIREKLKLQIEGYQSSAACLRKHPGGLCSVAVVTILQSTASFLVPYFIYKAFSLSDFSLLEIVAVQSVLNISVSSLPLPGAVGVSENGFLLLFRVFFGNQLIFPAMLLCRGINFYFLMILSGAVSLLFYCYLHRSKKVVKL